MLSEQNQTNGLIQINDVHVLGRGGKDFATPFLKPFY